MENYILYDEVGRGEHSVVYKGRKKGTIEFVAIHCVEKCKRLELRNIVRLTHEMDHLNVVKFREWYETTNHIWMVVELCTGDSLDAVLSQDKCLPVETVRQFGIEIAKALYYIHSLGILYCDLKPSRIMLDGAGVLKFSNFALARVEGEDDFYDSLQEEQNSDDEDKNYRDTEKDQSQRPKPSPHYMAPEVLSGGPHSKESDLWSFGCVLYELFSGEKPFVADSFAELVTKIFHENVPHLRLDMEGAKNGALHDLDNVIKRLLEKDPTQRLDWKDLIVHSFWQGELENQFKSADGIKGEAETEDQQELNDEGKSEELHSGNVGEEKEHVKTKSDQLQLPAQIVRQRTYTFSSRPHTADPASGSKENESLGKTHTVVRRKTSDDQDESESNSTKNAKRDSTNVVFGTSESKNNKSNLVKQNRTFKKSDFNKLKQNGLNQSEAQESTSSVLQDQQVKDNRSPTHNKISDLVSHPSDFIVTPIADNPRIKKFSLPKWDSKALPCQPLKPGELMDLPREKFEEHLTSISSLLSQNDRANAGPVASLHRSKLHTASYLTSLCRDGEIVNEVFDSDFIPVMLRQIKSGFSADFKSRLGKCHEQHVLPIPHFEYDSMFLRSVNSAKYIPGPSCSKANWGKAKVKFSFSFLLFLCSKAFSGYFSVFFLKHLIL